MKNVKLKNYFDVKNKAFNVNKIVLVRSYQTENSFWVLPKTLPFATASTTLP